MSNHHALLDQACNQTSRDGAATLTEREALALLCDKGLVDLDHHLDIVAGLDDGVDVGGIFRVVDLSGCQY